MKLFWRGAVVVLLVLVATGAGFYVHPLWVNDQLIRFSLWRNHAQSKYVEAGSYRLHYYELLPADGSVGTPLVLVHGLGAGAEDWEPLGVGLAGKGCQVYAPDLGGCGRVGGGGRGEWWGMKWTLANRE